MCCYIMINKNELIIFTRRFGSDAAFVAEVERFRLLIIAHLELELCDVVFNMVAPIVPFI